jgi:limonene-1,2-epoxide hydrolase
MTRPETHEAMQRYFDVLGSDRFSEAVDPAVTWTIEETGGVVSGADAVGQHLNALHGSMLETKTRDLVVADGVAVLEGSASAPGRPEERIAFAVVYEVRGGRVAAMRAYGGIEAAVLRSR